MSKAGKELAVAAVPAGTVTVEVAGPDYAAEFATVRKYNRMAQISAAQSAAFQILCGVELNRLKKSLGFGHGGSRKGDQAATRCRLKFSDLAEQHGGVSERMARNYCAMADAAKKRVPLLSAPEMLDTPLSQQPEERQTKLLDAVKKVTDGESARQLMIDWGICKKPQGSGAKGGGKGGKAVKDLSAEEQAALLLEQAREQWAEIVLLVQAYGDKFALLPDVEGQAQLGLLETHAKARHAWLDVAKEKRDVKVIGKILEA